MSIQIIENTISINYSFTKNLKFIKDIYEFASRLEEDFEKSNINLFKNVDDGLSLHIKLISNENGCIIEIDFEEFKISAAFIDDLSFYKEKTKYWLENFCKNFPYLEINRIGVRTFVVDGGKSFEEWINIIKQVTVTKIPWLNVINYESIQDFAFTADIISDEFQWHLSTGALVDFQTNKFNERLLNIKPNAKPMNGDYLIIDTDFYIDKKFDKSIDIKNVPDKIIHFIENANNYSKNIYNSFIGAQS